MLSGVRAMFQKPMQQDYSNHVAVITGGASGIGAATARAFHALGACVVIADLHAEKGGQLVAELGHRATFFRMDVRDESHVENLIAYAVATHGRIDTMFNNAGIPERRTSINDVTPELFEETINVDLRGVVFGVKHAARAMVQQGGGSIVNTASIAGLRTGYAGHIYSAAKAAVIHFTKSVAMELGPRNVRVNCVCPGAIATPIFAKGLGMSDAVADKSVDVIKRIFDERDQPIARSGTPEDIANAVVWLASEGAAYITGQELVIDGGLINGMSWRASEAAILARIYIASERPRTKGGEWHGTSSIMYSCC
jgi:NAD(P)-dependent dehydrogenase (short-subunit alcohol dehydrogenase family)